MPRLSVVIVNFNSGDRLSRCLDHLAAQIFTDFETIVVDNASADGSALRAQSKFPAVKFDKAETNLGFAAANNRAAKAAAGEWLVFLNPDAYADRDWLAELVAASERYSLAEAFGSTQANAADPSLLDGAGDVFHILGVPYRGYFGWPCEKLPPDGECFSVCAAAAMYRKTAFETLGGFDERFFCYGEDVDLGFRLRLAGGRAVQVRNARVLHEGSGVSGRHSDFTIYHGHRNRIWTAYKNLPAPLFWGALPLRLMVDLTLLARAIAGGYTKAYLQGVVDGYSGARKFKEDRRRIQQGRTISVIDLAKALTWSPLKLLRREGDIRPIDNQAAFARNQS